MVAAQTKRIVALERAASVLVSVFKNGLTVLSTDGTTQRFRVDPSTGVRIGTEPVTGTEPWAPAIIMHPTTISAGAVTIPTARVETSGAKKMATRKSAAVTRPAMPVRAPAATPAALSM